jgi:methionine biosynthesis protein MetW
MATPSSGERLDHRVIARFVETGSKVLDLGCGKGDLLLLLYREKQAGVHGIELDDKAVQECVKRGLSVFHGDIESGLSEYPDRSFDYVILNQSMQEVKRVDLLLQEALRVGAKVIVGFPNFAHVSARMMLLLKGKAPVTGALPYPWYGTPNVRFLSIRDFEDLCRGMGLRVLASVGLGASGIVTFFPNLFARDAVFVLSRGNGSAHERDPMASQKGEKR